MRFEQQLRETDEEAELRMRTVQRAESVLRTLNPDAQATLFGSAVSGLRLPYGDLDMHLHVDGIKTTTECASFMRRFETALRSAKVPSTTLVLTQARVPILKWTDNSTNCKVDACVNHGHGLRTSEWVAEEARALPALRPLVLVLKSQLLLHGLHTARTGGVGGYLLTHMVRHILLTRPPPLADHSESDWDRETWIGGQRIEPMPWAKERKDERRGAHDWVADVDGDEDLGGLLLRFYWYYGHEHNLGSTIVTDSAQGTSRARGRSQPGWLEHPLTQLSLSCPLRPRSDLGAAAHQFGLVRGVLRASYKGVQARLAANAAAAAVSGNSEVEDDEEWFKSLDPNDGASATASPLTKTKPSRQRALLSAVLPKWHGHHDGAWARRKQKAWVQISRRRRYDYQQMERHVPKSFTDGNAGAHRRDPLWQ